MTSGGLRALRRPRPHGALVERYASRGDYVDCFAVDVSGAVSISELVDAFFGSRAFEPERRILRALGRSSPIDSTGLTTGTQERPAAWTVEARSANQVLLCDFLSFTRCWLMVEVSPDDAARSRLYFGTAFARTRNPSAANFALRLVFSVLRPLHSAYAKILLNGAAARLRSRRAAGDGPAPASQRAVIALRRSAEGRCGEPR